MHEVALLLNFIKHFQRRFMCLVDHDHGGVAVSSGGLVQMVSFILCFFKISWRRVLRSRLSKARLSQDDLIHQQQCHGHHRYGSMDLDTVTSRSRYKTALQ